MFPGSVESGLGARPGDHLSYVDVVDVMAVMGVPGVLNSCRWQLGADEWISNVGFQGCPPAGSPGP